MVEWLFPGTHPRPDYPLAVVALPGWDCCPYQDLATLPCLLNPVEALRPLMVLQKWWRRGIIEIPVREEAPRKSVDKSLSAAPGAVPSYWRTAAPGIGQSWWRIRPRSATCPLRTITAVNLFTRGDLPESRFGRSGKSGPLYPTSFSQRWVLARLPLRLGSRKLFRYLDMEFNRRPAVASSDSDTHARPSTKST